MYSNYSASVLSGPDEILFRMMCLTVRDYVNCLCNVFQTWPIISPGFPVGVQPHPAYLARTRPEDPSSKIKTPYTKSLVVTLFSAFLMRLKSEGVHSAEADASCIFLFVCAEENREVCATTQFGGAHQFGRPDPVRVGAQQSRLTPRWQKQLGPGLLPHPVQAPPPSLLLQWRSRKHQESVRVPHQLHKEMGGQVRCILDVI